jgi:RNA polymerase sigma factor for flagellar operon FliA
VRFETYALQRIRGAIIDAIRSLSPMTRAAGARARLLDEATAALGQRLGRAPTRKELALELGINHAQFARTLFESAHAIVSLERPGVGDNDGEIAPLSDQLHDYGAIATDESVEEIELLERLAVVVDSLPPRDRLVLHLYYTEFLTLKEISRIIEVSESRVSQIHRAVIHKLRGQLCAQPPVPLAA